MQPSVNRLWSQRLCSIAVCAGLTAFASTAPASAQPIIEAIVHGDCNSAVDLVNRGVKSGDGQAVFLGARMLDEGICSDPDHAFAAKYFARAAILGDRAASLEYAADVGLGVGTEQSYELAGEICRAAGLDPQSRLSGYSLGYSCTVRGVAGRLARQTLPPDVFRVPTEARKVEFRPATSQLRILSVPRVAVESAPATGSIVRRPRMKVEPVIEETWRNALASVPKPDPVRLDDQAIELRSMST